MDEEYKKLAAASGVIVQIIEAIVKMSDDVKNGLSPLDKQGKLLNMQNSIQKNANRIVPYVKTVVDAIDLTRK